MRVGLAGPGPTRVSGRDFIGSKPPIAWCVRLLAVPLLACLVANCSSSQVARGRFGNKYGVAASPKVIADGDPVPKGGGRDMIGKPYVVGDTTYVPAPGKGYVREGSASWYGTAFHGRLTANGEIFDKDSIAAAHPTLPLPSYVRVTNLINRASMIVRVNDRGPYERGRLMDVSERVAEALQFRRAGTSRVRVEYVGRASLKGSDDRKLLATLRNGDVPFRERTVRLAQFDEAEPGLPRLISMNPASARRPVEGTDEAPVVAQASRPRPTEQSAAAQIDVDQPAPRTGGPVQAGRLSEAGPAPMIARPPLGRPVQDAASDPALRLTPKLQLPPERPILAGLY